MTAKKKGAPPPTATTTSEAGVAVLASLVGARVQRVDVPEPDLVAIGLHHARVSSTLVLSLAESGPGLGVVAERPRGAPAGSVAQLFRKYLSGAVLDGARAIATGAIDLTFARDGERTALRAKLTRRNAGLVLIGASGRALGGLPRGPRSVDELVGEPDAHEWPQSDAELLEAGRRLLAKREGSESGDPELRRALLRDRKRLGRRVAAIEGDRIATADAPRLRRDAAIVLGAIASIARGATEHVGADPTTDEPIRIALDPASSAAENAERMFVRARKLDRGATIAKQRWTDASDELAVLDAALIAFDAGDPAPARALLARPAKVKGTETRRLPYRVFPLEDGTVVWVGRSAADNDALTFKHAAPDDWFFHARAHRGAHVILRSPPGRPPSDDARTAAAVLAAHFSSLRTELAADVMVAARRSIRRGSPRGTVIAPTSTTVRVGLAAYPVAALLARERR
jgi:predicted ribosome quality control (RQC) complex YloA/Tae2 family protein